MSPQVRQLFSTHRPLLLQHLSCKPVPRFHVHHHIRTMATPSVLASQIQTLKKYTACDIADALLKLKVPGSGFLPDLSLYPSPSGTAITQRELLIAPASTVLFTPKTTTSTTTTDYPPANIPQESHWVDLTKSDTIVILSQPHGQKNAILGGIMAQRIKALSAQGVIVYGRVRDIPELATIKLPIWALGTSIVGAGAESKAHAVQVPLVIEGTEVKPGDLVCCDAANGVVIVPSGKVEEVLGMLPGLVEADDKVKVDVEGGVSVQEAFKKHRN